MHTALRKIISIADTELSISTSPVLIMLAVVSLTILFIGEDMAGIAIRTQWEITGIILLAWTVVGWRISSWSVLVSKWLLIVILVALIVWLRFSPIKLTDALVLFSIPTYLAAA